VADTTQPRLVWEVPYYPAYYFPVEDVRTDLLVPTATVSHSPRRGDAQHFTVKAGSREAEDAALRYVDSPIEELRDVASSMIPAEDLGGGYLAVRDERGRVSGAVGGRFHRRVRGQPRPASNALQACSQRWHTSAQIRQCSCMPACRSHSSPQDLQATAHAWSTARETLAS
jgi:hypothetical protein